MTSGLAQLNGVELYFDDRGSGPTVVLAHAGIADPELGDVLDADTWARETAATYVEKSGRLARAR